MSFDPKPWAAKAATCPWRVNTMFHAHPSFSCSKYCYQLDVWEALPPHAEFGMFECWKHHPHGKRWDQRRALRLAERDRRVDLILAEIVK